MRPSTAAALEIEISVKEFGTGLRERLALVGALEVRETAAFGAVPRRDVSPELVLVSADVAADGEGGLAELVITASEARRAPLGTLLAEAGLLGATDIDVALDRARETGLRLGELLVEQGLVTSADIVRLVAAQRGLPYVDVRTVAIDRAAARLLPADFARVLCTLPLGFVRGLPVVAVADPTDEDVMDGARSVLRSARFVASPADAIQAQLARVY
jgi:Type II secretion system (T2SS), protein E, N-terminal domain